MQMAEGIKPDVLFNNNAFGFYALGDCFLES